MEIKYIGIYVFLKFQNQLNQKLSNKMRKILGYALWLKSHTINIYFLYKI